MKKKFTLVLLSAWMLLLQRSATAQNTPVYAHAFQSTHDQGVWARAVTTDAQNNVYLTGLFHGTCDFDPSENQQNLTYLGGTPGDVDGESDVFISKYDANGNLVWAKSLFETTFDGMNEERPTAIALDNQNNLYLCGFTGTRGVFISKWSTNGDEIWTRYFNDAPENNALTFGIKPISGGVVVNGFFTGTLDFDPSPTSVNSLTAFNNDAFLLSLDVNGNFAWVKQIESNGAVILTGLDTTTQGEIITSGVFVGSVDLNPDPNVQSIFTSQSTTFSAFSSIFAAKYSSSGDLIWSKHYRGTATTDFLTTLVKTDSQNNVIVLSDFKGSTSFSTTTTVSSTSNYNTFLSKANSNGILLWAKKIVQNDGFIQTANGANMAIDGCDNIYVSGEFTGTCDFDPSANTHELQSLTNTRAVFISSYSQDGNYLSAFPIKGLGQPDFVEFNGYLPIAVDADQNLIAGGTFRNTLDFDPTDNTLELHSSVDPNSSIAGVFLTKYPNPSSCALANPTFTEGSLTIFPNPAQDEINIHFKENQSQMIAQMIDMQGRIVLHESFQNNQHFTLDIKNLPAGMYLLKIQTDKQTFTQKIIHQ
ncbi:MAG: T9SS type A sorting domain-containing protein [Bacteroidetes bacterium]|nr:T9SS type A sorting domain-containing protein [Bacteroidota bacterium]